MDSLVGIAFLTLLPSNSYPRYRPLSVEGGREREREGKNREEIRDKITMKDGEDEKNKETAEGEKED